MSQWRYFLLGFSSLSTQVPCSVLQVVPCFLLIQTPSWFTLDFKLPGVPFLSVEPSIRVGLLLLFIQFVCINGLHATILCLILLFWSSIFDRCRLAISPTSCSSVLSPSECSTLCLRLPSTAWDKSPIRSIPESFTADLWKLSGLSFRCHPDYYSLDFRSFP